MPLDLTIRRPDHLAALPDCPDLGSLHPNWLVNPDAHPNPRARDALREHAGAAPVRPAGNAAAWQMARNLGIASKREDRA